jgi:hypothetical protein
VVHHSSASLTGESAYHVAAFTGRTAVKSTFSTAILIGLVAGITTAIAQNTGQAPPTPPAQNATAAPRPTPPTRDPNTPGFVPARELPDGTVPPSDTDGNFVIGPAHPAAPEMSAQDGVPQGTIYNLTMSSADSKMYPGIARDAGTFGTVDPSDPAKLVVTTSLPAPTPAGRGLRPQTMRSRRAAPFIVGADGPIRCCSRRSTI